MTEQNFEVYTIGHGNTTAERIIEMLRQYKIAELVDVRSVPYSEYKPEFNRETFKATLETAGIKYAFAGEYLGGRPKDDNLYKNNEVPDAETSRAKFLKLVDYKEVAKQEYFQKGIARLLEIAAQHPTAIMCSEEDPDQCHRSKLIGQHLVRMNLVVKHIRKDDAQVARLELELLKPEQLNLF